jgi:hypothetical protein
MNADRGVQRVRVLSITDHVALKIPISPYAARPLEAGLEMIDARTSAPVMLKFDTLHAHFPKHLVTDVHYRRP